jgi:hypothetical protein
VEKGMLIVLAVGGGKGILTVLAVFAFAYTLKT